jgi:hypothetical protein
LRLCDRPPLRDCPPDDPRDERDPLLERELDGPPLLLCRDDRLRAWLLPELLEPPLSLCRRDERLRV